MQKVMGAYMNQMHEVGRAWDDMQRHHAVGSSQQQQIWAEYFMEYYYDWARDRGIHGVAKHHISDKSFEGNQYRKSTY